MSYTTKTGTSHSEDLIERTFAYRGGCTVCKKSKYKNLYSLHQAPTEHFNEQIHGPMQTKDKMTGIYKSIKITQENVDVDDMKEHNVFHQIAKDAMGKYIVFSPLHAACDSCIQKITSISPVRCHICSEEIVETISRKKATKGDTTLATLTREASTHTRSSDMARSYLDYQLSIALSITPKKIDLDDFFYRSLPRVTKQHLQREGSFTRQAQAFVPSLEDPLLYNDQ